MGTDPVTKMGRAMSEQNHRKLLTLVIEESAEVMQEICKMLHFGLDNVNPVTGVSNQEKLHAEVGDVLAVLEMMVDRGYLDWDKLQAGAERKVERLKKWHPDLFN